MKILVLNSGSSSIKFKLFSMKDSQVIASGIIEQIGEPIGKIKISSIHHKESLVNTIRIEDHQQGIDILSSILVKEKLINDLSELDGIGHRIVHGGTVNKPQLVTEELVEKIVSFSILAPLHNPPGLAGIKAAKTAAPKVPQAAIFDTAFHQTLPMHAYMYALPYEMCERLQIRRYGFHGTSHQFVASEAAKELKKPLSECNLITLHLGNGDSAAAIKHGECVDTSMGISPLEGLIMGTRSGDIDPAILFYLAKQDNLTISELDTLLNKKSGLRGICGTNDMREIMLNIENGDQMAKLAFDMFCYKIKKYIGAYLAILGKIDAIIFTGGIGENAIDVRLKICEDLDNFGIILDKEKNKIGKDGIIHIEDEKSSVKIMVIPTNEELAIAKQTEELILKSNENC